MHEQILIAPTKLHHYLWDKMVGHFLVKFYGILDISHKLYSLHMCVNMHRPHTHTHSATKVHCQDIHMGLRQGYCKR